MKPWWAKSLSNNATKFIQPNYHRQIFTKVSKLKKFYEYTILLANKHTREKPYMYAAAVDSCDSSAGFIMKTLDQLPPSKFFYHCRESHMTAHLSHLFFHRPTETSNWNVLNYEMMAWVFVLQERVHAIFSFVELNKNKLKRVAAGMVYWHNRYSHTLIDNKHASTYVFTPLNSPWLDLRLTSSRHKTQPRTSGSTWCDYTTLTANDRRLQV